MVNGTLLIPSEIQKDLSSVVKNELAKMPPQKQEEFVEEFKRKKKSVGTAYLLWFLFGVHHIYLGKIGLWFLYILTVAGWCIWGFIELFRIPSEVRNKNKDIATDILRNIKVISS